MVDIEDTYFYMLFIVALRGIPTRGQGVMHVGTKLDFYFNEIFLGMRPGPHGKVDGIFGLVMGCHPQTGIKYSN